MEHFLKDNDTLLISAFIKIADINRDSQIPVPNGVAEVAKDAYDNRIVKYDDFGEPVVKEIVQYDVPYLKTEVIKIGRAHV